LALRVSGRAGLSPNRHCSGPRIIGSKFRTRLSAEDERRTGPITANHVE